MNNINLIYKSVKYAVKNLQLNEPNIFFLSRMEFPNEEITAMFLKNKNAIVFNVDWVKTAKITDLINVCFHEVRHIYQKVEIEKYSNGLDTTEESHIIERWKKDFENYTQPNLFNDLKYMCQAIEIDALEYTKYMVDKLLDNS